MKLLIRLALRCYPPAWRARYESEFTALLDQASPDWFTVLDVWKGAFLMRLSTPPFVISAFALSCCLIAFIASFTVQKRYVSTMTFSVRDQSSHTDNRNLHLARTINGMAQQALTRAALTEIITNRNLYYEQRQHMPLEDVVEQMRAKDIRISNVVGFDTGGQRTPAFQVSFAAPDGGTAQLVTRDIAQRLTTAQRNVAPDARIEVLEIANLPVQPMSPARQNFAIAGLLAGLSLGALYVWYRSRRTLASPS